MITGQQSDFIKFVASIAVKDAPLYGIHVVSPIIAQAIIESKWGKSGLAVNGKNLFGIKCGSSWKGDAINMKTMEEYTPGTHTQISALFRKYNSWEESIHDYFKFTNTKRYAALKKCTTPIAYCMAIKAAGYATSSTYVNTLMNCINTYDLTAYDGLTEAEVNKPEIDYSVQVPEITNTPIEHVTSVIDYSKVVEDVIKGLYSTGDDRIIRLARNGYNPLAVQYMVNQAIKIKDLTAELKKAYNVINKVKEVVS